MRCSIVNEVHLLYRYLAAGTNTHNVVIVSVNQGSKVAVRGPPLVTRPAKYFFLFLTS
jgi:hypothetical protein